MNHIDRMVLLAEVRSALGALAALLFCLLCFSGLLAFAVRVLEVE